MAIKNYTTQIDFYKTIGEIQQILSKAGVKKIIIDNDEKNNPVSIKFTIVWNGNTVLFNLPCKFDGVKKSLQKSKAPKSLHTDEQALRIGWRIIKDWIDAQMAIVEAELASITEVFLPYAVSIDGITLFEYIEQNKSVLKKLN